MCVCVYAESSRENFNWYLNSNKSTLFVVDMCICEFDTIGKFEVKEIQSAWKDE